MMVHQPLPADGYIAFIELPLVYFHAVSMVGSGALILDRGFAIFKWWVMSVANALAATAKEETPVRSDTHCTPALEQIDK